MRIYADCYELMSEIFREVWEMGHIVHPHSMQNKVVKDDDSFSTKEITNYSYSLTSLNKEDYLFFADSRAKAWADAEFYERVDSDYSNPGEAWKLRPDLWKQFLNELGQFDYSYNRRIGFSIHEVINELTINPDSRQAIIAIWDPMKDPAGLGGKFRVPCSMYYQFLVRGGKVNVIYNQRSADVVTHFGNDVYLAYQLMLHISIAIHMDPGYLFHNIGSLHAYKKDWPQLKQCIEDIKV